MNNIFLKLLLALFLITGIHGCVNMWDAGPDEKDICPVITDSGLACSFPFVYQTKSYQTCIIGGPINPNKVPQCLTTAGTWSFCQVPNNSTISYVTTRKAGSSDQNKASVNGETLLWIYGLRFAKNAFSMSPSMTKSNRIILVGQFASYNCELHEDKCTETQLTCWTPALPVDSYLVRVYVNDYLIPLYQYESQPKAVIESTYSATPYLKQFKPNRGLPGSFVEISGQFYTDCYGRDIDVCADDSGARISRLYFGPQSCDLMDPTTNALYNNLTTTWLSCKLKGQTVGLFNGTMIVTEDFGRSYSDPATFLVTPDEIIYNYQTYAEITSITPNIGSTEGGTDLTITGKYLYHSEDIPAQIYVANTPCTVKSLNNADPLNTVIVCTTQEASPTGSEFIGNRGINMLRQNVYTAFASLGSATPANTATIWLDEMRYTDTNNSDVTVWLNGYMVVARDSDYLMSLTSNGVAVLYLSTDATGVNKQLVATVNGASKTNTTVTLQASKSYYIQVIASRINGSLTVSANAKMFNSTLNGKSSAMVKTEVQEIEISSTIIPEKTDISYNGLTTRTGTAEVQEIKIIPLATDPFQLSFDGANTILLNPNAVAADVKKALSDLPTLYPEGVSSVTEKIDSDGFKIYTITFSADRGDVPDVIEASGTANYTTTEISKGVSTQAKFQYKIQDAWSNFFDLVNDQPATIKNVINEVFSIRCPTSIIKANPANTFTVFDYESECQFDEKPLNSTAFCGQCARKNSNSFFWSQDIPLTYNFLCFAYKLTGPITNIGYRVKVDVNTFRDAYTTMSTTADNEWHYTCVDLYQALLLNWNTNSATYPASGLSLQRAWFYPVVKDVYIDAVSLKNALPIGYTDNTLVASRRLIPNMQIVYNSLTVTRNNASISIAFRPNKCVVNLADSELRQASSSLITKVSNVSGPITGSFDISWNGVLIKNISANADESAIRSVLQSINGLGKLNVDRTKDCAGFKWRIEWFYGGNQPPISISSNILDGNNVSIVARTVVDGGVEFYPIQGDMIRTLNPKPEIAVAVNGIPSKCSANCIFEWSSTVTPQVTSIDTSNSLLIRLTGSGFEATTSSNLVFIGETPCNVTSATSTELLCEPGKGPVGTYSFNVNVLGKGNARIIPSTTFTFAFNATSISPSTSGTGGGVKLEITGTGFSSQSKVTIDGINCPVKSFTYNKIECLVPPNPTTTDKSVNVEVVDNGTSVIASQQLFYDNTNTPSVTFVTPSTSLNVLGGETITINGTSFDLTNLEVFFGNVRAQIISNTTTQIVVKSPSMNPGQYKLIIPCGSLGNVKANLVLEYTLYVSSFTPSAGSIRGGSLVTVYGDGFNQNCSLNSVAFGDSECKLIDCSSSWIRCITTNAYNVHQIDNNGIDPNYGLGYSWSIQYLKINKGDYVQWTWAAPASVTGISYKVEQVADPMSFEPIGFSSGMPKSSGSYSYQFNQIGTYYYWSGFVDANMEISFRGVIEVVAARDNELTIDVSVGNIKAQKCVFPFAYKNQNYVSCTNIDLGYNWCSPTAQYSGQDIKCSSLTQPTAPSCPGIDLDISSCATNSTSSIYNFLFTECNVATIDSIEPLAASAGDNITINGTGFSKTLCENEVYIGSYSCPVTYSSANQIVCTIGTGSGLIPNVGYVIEVRTKNAGNAIQSTWNEFKLLPKITSISPTIGSTSGGTLVNVSGDGFDARTMAITFAPVDDLVITFTTITFRTRPNQDQIIPFSLKSNSIDAMCTITPACQYEFSTSIAPTLSLVTPTSVSGIASIEIDGTNFGTDFTKLSVKIGRQPCVISSSNETTIFCSLSGLEVGVQNVYLNLYGVGNAIENLGVTVTGVAAVSSLTPNSGGIYGGTEVTIAGNGFDTINNTQVLFGTSLCKITSLSVTSLACVTAQGSSGVATVSITSNSQSFPTTTFTYDSSISPTITSVSPTSGTTGDLLTITGTGFGSVQNDVTVTIGVSSCVIVIVSNTEIKCNLGANMAGSYPVIVNINAIGFANKNINFNYILALTSLSSTEGSFGGGLVLTLSGSGFTGADSLVSICSSPCKVLNDSTSTQIFCIVPAKTYAGSDVPCSVVVTVGALTASLTFTYKISLTPSLTSVSPLRGGTAGGTILTLTGSGFPTTLTDIKVTIAGSTCIVSAATSTSITCATEPYTGSSIKAPVMIHINNIGYATTSSPVLFQYIDLWSSKFTWGGESTPVAGEIAVVGPGQTIYLDTETPVLKGLIIQGGSLIFDDNQDVYLKAEYIVISDGGSLVVGTEAQPFQHKATITMYGTLRSIELPIYGSKVLALRNGTIDLHGKPVGVTWTYLTANAPAQSTTITVQDAISWPVGSKIVIATTGNFMSQQESEVRTITAVSGNTITLNEPLKFSHWGEKRTVGGKDVYLRAEVGLLSRNVLFNAINDDSWNSLRSAKACPEGFDPSEFAVMTCFLGRYGDEIGSDEFGATLMLNGAVPNRIGNEVVIARISNVEFNHVGQAFRLGRYPIHFHLIGDSPSSYVRECAIHESFNRAVNIHGTNYVTVQRNVIYNIMGGAYFLEDGIEIGNVFDGNLAVFVKTSSSLLNEDVTPAAFWATNPNNTYTNNAVAGGTHFGWWYRILDRSDGPSYNPNFCPKKQPFGKFYNNSVHSTGRFGIWIFPGYRPSVSGGCYDYKSSPAKFVKFVAYGNQKGAEWVEASNIQFIDFTVYDNTHAGIEGKTSVDYSDFNSYHGFEFYSETNGSLIKDVIAIGTTNPSDTNITVGDGVILSWERGQLLKNATFINYINSNTYPIRATLANGRCLDECGGWTHQVTGLSFTNVKYRAAERWNWDSIMEDLDGSLTGTPGNLVLFNGNITGGDSRCTPSPLFYQGTICRNMKTFVRMAFNNFNPELAVFIELTDERNNTDFGPKKKKRLTHPQGFEYAMEVNRSYEVAFEHAHFPTNISFSGGLYGLKPYEWIIIKHRMIKKPDQVSFAPKTVATESKVPLSMSVSGNTDWYWENATKTLSYILHNRQGRLPMLDVELKFSAVKCRFANCEVPVQPALRLPATERSPYAVNWSSISTWTFAEPGYGGYYGNGQYGLPREGDIVKIPQGAWVVVDCVTPVLKRIQIEGVLEFDDTIDHTLSVEQIFINGGQLIAGWENKPFIRGLKIILLGNRSNEELVLPNGFDSMGSKAIGVYGGLDLHGVARQPTWTRLAQTAKIGSNVLALEMAVDWKAGEEIMVTTTSFSQHQTETFRILSVSADKKTLTLNSSLLYDHIAMKQTFPNGMGYDIAAGVGLLTRNIKIIGGEYPDQYSELFGSRIIVSDYSVNVYPDGGGAPTLVYYKGYARLSGVEWIHGGQYSRASDDDYRYAVLYSNLQTYDYKRPSYVKNCSFHDGFSAAVGILASASIPIENNVIHRTLDFSVRLKGHSNIVRKNLIAFNIWSPTFYVRDAPYDKFYWGAIDISLADSAVVEDNMITASQRVGIHMRGSPCPGDSIGVGINHSTVRNHIYGCMHGIVVFPDDGFTGISCSKIEKNTVFKSIHWGIYFNTFTNEAVEGNTMVDNTINIFMQVFTPSSKDHALENRYMNVTNNLLVGRSVSFNCTSDIYPDDINMENSKFSVAYTTESGGFIGIVSSNFVDGTNVAPLKPWSWIKTYNALGGLTTMYNNTFARFGEYCTGQRDAAVSTSKNNDDGQHPVEFKSTYLYEVLNSSKIYFFRPNQWKINPKDCIDMDCDGLKKNLYTDLDGTLLGSPGSVISQSEFGWGLQERGLGDFRIPKEMLAAPNGSMIAPKLVYKYKGIVRDESKCTYVPDWQAYECHGLLYKMLIIESMDNDTETRRLSPVAILSDNKYLDLINGPQDQTCCFGYTCQKRISTFLALVTANQHFDIYLTSTPPNHLRLRVINADASFKIRLSVYYFTSNSVNVYKKNTIVQPTNADTSKGYLVLKDPQGNSSSYLPAIGSACGTNYMSRDERKLYVSLDGADYVDLKISPEIFLTFGVPAMTAETFFNSANLVNNLATLLGVPANMIRRVNVVRESSTSRIAKRSASLHYLEIVIADDPVSTVTDENTYNQKLDQINSYAAQIVNLVHVGELQQAAKDLFNLTIASTDYEQTPNDNRNYTSVTVKKVQNLKVVQQFAGCRAHAKCDTQAIVQVIDENGDVITDLGSSGHPWVVRATLKESSQTAQIINQQTAEVVDGKAIFENLGLSNTTDRFVIEFSFDTPTSLNQSQINSFKEQTRPASVQQPVLAALPLDTSKVVLLNESFDLSFGIGDKFSKMHIPNLEWTNRTWTATIRTKSLTKWQPSGALNVKSVVATFDSSTGVATFTNVSINSPGMYLLSVTIRASDGSLTLTCDSNYIQVLEKALTNTIVQATDEQNLVILFDGDYDTLSSNGEIESMRAMFYNYLVNKLNATIVGDISVYKGSVGFALNVEPSADPLKGIASIVNATDILPGLTIKSVQIYDTVYSKAASSASSSSSSSSSSQSNGGAIAGGVIGGLVAVAIVAALGFFGYRYYKNKQYIHEVNQPVRPLTTKPNKGNKLRHILSEEKFETTNNDFVTISREKSTIGVALPNPTFIGEHPFLNTEGTHLTARNVVIDEFDEAKLDK